MQKHFFATAAVAAFAFGAHAAPEAYTSGHADLDFAFEGGEWEAGWHAHDDPGDPAIIGGVSYVDVEFEAEDVYALVPAASSITRPADPLFDLTGVAAGENLPVIYQLQGPAAAAGAPWLGIAAEEIDPGVFVGDTIDISLVSVAYDDAGTGAGGGEFSIWQTDGLGAVTFLMASSDGISASDTLVANVGAHDHYNYGFSGDGIYNITFEASGELVSTGLDSGIQQTFTFVVGIPEPASASILGGLGLLLRRRR